MTENNEEKDVLLQKAKPKRKRIKLNRNWRRVVVLGSLLVLIYLVAVFAPYLTPHDPYQVSVRDRLKPPGFVSQKYGLFLLGTDGVGRDVLSRVILGARPSLFVATSAVVLAGVFGSTLGLLAGFFGGRVDAVIMRLGDIWLAFPAILLALSVAAVLGPTLINLVFAIGLSRWVSYARLVRAIH